MKNLCFLFLVVLISCTAQDSPLQTVTNLPGVINESSALEIEPGSAIFWTHNDSGNEPVLYGIDKAGNMQAEIRLINEENTDWEELAFAPDGRLFVGDIGNNANERKNLRIHILKSVPEKGLHEISGEVITFTYEDQEKFPPKKEKQFYDAEGIIYHKDSLFIISKNRAKPFDGSARVYVLPATPGNYTAKYRGTLSTCDNRKKCMVTAADISNDGTKVAVLTHESVWLFEMTKDGRFWEHPIQEIPLHHKSQKEGICFDSEGALWITDERTGKVGGKMYRLGIRDWGFVK